MLTQKQRKAAAAPKLTEAELARLEREQIRAELAARELAEDFSDGPKFKPSAEALAAAEARKAAGPVELTTKWLGRTFPAEAPARPVPNPAKSWELIGRAGYSRLELADMAAEAKRLEREANRRRPDTFKAAAVQRSAIVLLADMPAAEVAKQSRLRKAAEDYAAMAEVAAAVGVEVSELAEALETEKLLVADGTKPLRDSSSEVGYADTTLTPREVLEHKAWAADMLQYPEAVAAREVLAAIGPRASAVVSTNVYMAGSPVTVSLVRTVPDIGAAEARISALTKPLTEAREALAKAEAKVKAAAKLKAVKPLKSAEADADRIAAGVRKLAKRMESAEAARDLALELAAMPNADDLVTVPMATFGIGEAAAEAAALEIPDRADRMPSAFVERGPRVRTSASWSGQTQHGGRGSGVSDPTGDSAAAIVDGYAREVAKVERAEVKLAKRVEQSREVFKANQRSDYKAREAARKRTARRNAKNKH